MAFILAPACSQSSYSPRGFFSPAIRPAYRHRGVCSPPRRPQYSSFNHFFGQVDELLDEISHQAQRQAQFETCRKNHHQRQLRKRLLRAQFAVSQNEQGWQINGDIQGFKQENLSIEVINEYTVKVAGNTEWQLEKVLPQNDAISTMEQSSENAQVDQVDETTLVKADTTVPILPDSDTESHKSHQATVEDDFEDLGAETSSLISTISESSTISEIAELKGKERVVEEPNIAESNVPSQELNEESQESQEPEHHHGSFERTFRFPERIDATNVHASFKDGNLSITVPRAPVQQPKTIAIL